ncbi:MAG TPA: hypothetical protein VGE97_06345 [Nitrososphaera sp.]
MKSKLTKAKTGKPIPITTNAVPPTTGMSSETRRQRNNLIRNGNKSLAAAKRQAVRTNRLAKTKRRVSS